MQNSGHAFFQSPLQLTEEESLEFLGAVKRIYRNHFASIIIFPLLVLAVYALVYGANSFVIGAVVLAALILPNTLFLQYLKKRDVGFLKSDQINKKYMLFTSLQNIVNQQKETLYFNHLMNTMKSYKNNQEVRTALAELEEELQVHDQENKKANRAIGIVMFCLAATTITMLMTSFLAMFIGVLLFLSIYAVCIMFIYTTLMEKHATVELETEVMALKRVLEIEDATEEALATAA